MHLSTNAIVVIFVTGFVIAWVVGETMGGWRLAQKMAKARARTVED